MRLLKSLCISVTAAILSLSTVNAEINAAGHEDVTTYQVTDNFRTSKNILFSCMYGGSSHVNWVLTILEELSNRGHSTFFQTKDDHVKFSKNFQSINTSSLGPPFDPEVKKQVTKKLQSDFLTGYKDMLTASLQVFEEEYIKIRDFISSHNIDVAICDSLNHACVEASLSSQIPFLITTAIPGGEGASAPYVNDALLVPGMATTEQMSLRQRLNSFLVTPLRAILKFSGLIHKQGQTYMALGLTSPKSFDDKWRDSVKLFNSAFGFQPAQPVGPLVEYIGPIIPRNYPKLDSQTERFLNSRSKVVYVAFGQHAMATASDGRLVLTALIEALESKQIDGVLWATRDTSGLFPSYITSSSNTTYDISELADPEKSSDIKFVEWAPQMAILQHPSTRFFITHGGLGSIYETMYAGKPALVYPFFLDQPSNADNVEKSGIGLRLERGSSQEVANKIVARMAVDENRTIQSNTDRFKAYIQIRSRQGAGRGADVIEEVLFTHTENGKLPHRYPVSRNMSFLKAHNYDIYLFLLGSTLCFGYGVFTIFKYFTTPVPKSKVL